MSTQIFHHFAEHLALGRLDLPTDDITIALINSSTPVAGIAVEANAYSIPTASWVSAWTSYIATSDVEVSNVTSSLVTGEHKLIVEDQTFAPGSNYTAYGLLFYWDSGVAGTSPLIAVDIWDVPVALSTGTSYDWVAPAYLTRMVVNP